MMSNLTAQDDEQNKQFKPKIYQGKRRAEMRILYDKCNLTKEITRTDIDQTVGIEEFHLVVGNNVDEIS